MLCGYGYTSIAVVSEPVWCVFCFLSVLSLFSVGGSGVRFAGSSGRLLSGMDLELDAVTDPGGGT